MSDMLSPSSLHDDGTTVNGHQSSTIMATTTTTTAISPLSKHINRETVVNSSPRLAVTTNLRGQEDIISSLKKECFDLKLRNHYLQLALSQAGSVELTIVLQENAQLKVDADGLENELYSRNNLLKQAKQAMSSLARDVSKANKAKEEVERQLVELSNNSEPKHSSVIEVLRNEIHTKSEELAAVKEECTRHEAMTSDLLAVIERNKETANESNRLLDERDNCVQRLEAMLATFRSEDASSKVIELRRSLNIAEEKSASLEEKLKEKVLFESISDKERIEELEAELSELKNNAHIEEERARISVEALDRELEVLSQRESTAQTNSHRWQHEANAAHEVSELLSKEIEDARLKYNHDLNAVNEKISGLENDLNKCQCARKESEQRFRDVEQLLLESEEARASESKVSNDLKKRYGDLQLEFNNFETLISELRESKLRNDDALVKANESIECAKNDAELGQGREKELEHDIIEYKAELNRVSTELYGLKSRENALQRQIESEHASMEKLRQTEIDLRNELTTTRDQGLQSEAENRKALERSLMEISLLRDQNAREIQEAQRRDMVHTERNALLEEELGILKRKDSDLRLELEEAISECEKLKRHDMSRELEIERLQQQLVIAKNGREQAVADATENMRKAKEALEVEERTTQHLEHALAEARTNEEGLRARSAAAEHAEAAAIASLRRQVDELQVHDRRRIELERELELELRPRERVLREQLQRHVETNEHNQATITERDISLQRTRDDLERALADKVQALERVNAITLELEDMRRENRRLATVEEERKLRHQDASDRERNLRQTIARLEEEAIAGTRRTTAIMFEQDQSNKMQKQLTETLQCVEQLQGELREHSHILSPVYSSLLSFFPSTALEESTRGSSSSSLSEMTAAVVARLNKISDIRKFFEVQAESISHKVVTQMMDSRRLVEAQERRLTKCEKDMVLQSHYVEGLQKIRLHRDVLQERSAALDDEAMNQRRIADEHVETTLSKMRQSFEHQLTRITQDRDAARVDAEKMHHDVKTLSFQLQQQNNLVAKFESMRHVKESISREHNSTADSLRALTEQNTLLHNKLQESYMRHDETAERLRQVRDHMQNLKQQRQGLMQHMKWRDDMLDNFLVRWESNNGDKHNGEPSLGRVARRFDEIRYSLRNCRDALEDEHRYLSQRSVHGLHHMSGVLPSAHCSTNISRPVMTTNGSASSVPHVSTSLNGDDINDNHDAKRTSTPLY